MNKLKNIFSFFKKKVENKIEELTSHKVPVYDGCDGLKCIEWSNEPLSVTHLTRIKHTFKDYTTYSFNTHYESGLIFMGLVPDKPFGYQENLK